MIFIKNIQNYLKKIPLPGYRNIKTGIAIFLCIIIYNLLKRDNVILATSAALICMESSVGGTFKAGINRITGTFFGGLFALVTILLRGYFPNSFFGAVIIGLGIIVLIYFCNIIKKREMIVIACFVYLVIAVDINPTTKNPYIYSITRVLDTTIGVIITLLVNYFFFRPNHDRIDATTKILEPDNFKYKILRTPTYIHNSWSGGISNQIIIYPKNSIFAERNFKWRISISTVDNFETTFSILKNFKRNITILTGNLKLNQNNETIQLNKYDNYEFDASIYTDCIGLSKDFNLIYQNDYDGNVEIYNNFTNYEIDKDKKDILVIYSLYDDLIIKLDFQGKENLEVNIDKNDSFVIENINKLENNFFISAFISDSKNTDQKVSVVASIKNLKL